MRDAHMRRTQSQRCEAKHVNRRKGSTSSVIGVSHFSRRTKRRLYYKLQLWMWRKRQEKCRLAIFRAKKENRGSISSSACLSVRTRPQKKHTPHQSGGLSYSQNVGTEECASAGIQTTETRQTLMSPNAEDVASLGDIIDPGGHSPIIKPVLSSDSDACELTTHLREPRTLDLPPCSEVDGAVEQLSTVSPCRPTSPQTHTNFKELTKNIYEFLDDFYRIYGSFIPLQKRDVLKHLKRKFNTEFTDRKNTIFPEVAKYQSVILQKAVSSFQVVYRKHTLTLDDLSTLADQNWLNDQVMNMYGELIMDSSDHKVHFLNSFFHRQLMTKGYDGVKRWTKQVDLFSKRLLLVPIHLEVHWCLVAADYIRKKICLYDSQGNALQKVARNILKYLMAEAKERKQTAFENGWILSFDEKIPQQTNENDCGVFVLEYSRRLALGKPLQFSQKDIPKIRKRIYKELCDCKVHVC